PSCKTVMHRPALVAGRALVPIGLATVALVGLAFGAAGQTLPPGGSGRPTSAAEEGIELPNGAVTRLGSARFRFPGGSGGPIVYSADGTLLAFSSSIIYSPDGKLLGPRSGGVRVFEVATGRVVHQLLVPGGHSPQVIRFLDDGKRIAVGSFADRGVQLTFFS